MSDPSPAGLKQQTTAELHELVADVMEIGGPATLEKHFRFPHVPEVPKAEQLDWLKRGPDLDEFGGAPYRGFRASCPFCLQAVHSPQVMKNHKSWHVDQMLRLIERRAQNET